MMDRMDMNDLMDREMNKLCEPRGGGGNAYFDIEYCDTCDWHCDTCGCCSHDPHQDPRGVQVERPHTQRHGRGSHLRQERIVMDPYEAYKMMLSEPEDSVERGEAAFALMGWFEREGFWDEAVLGVTLSEARDTASGIADQALFG